MLSEKIHTRSASETKDYAKNLAKKLDIGTVVALIGNLGSGKTTFAQGFAEGLNIFESIVSPTFKLVSEYDGENCKLIHVDTYRLDGINDFHVEGVLEGKITKSKVGSNGFGYDPIFFSEKFNMTLAQMNNEQKNNISHRGLAIKKFVTKIRDL